MIVLIPTVTFKKVHVYPTIPLKAQFCIMQFIGFKEGLFCLSIFLSLQPFFKHLLSRASHYAKFVCSCYCSLCLLHELFSGGRERTLDFDFATHTATANTLIYFRFVVDACSELNLRQANCLSSIFYLKFRFDTQ